MQKQTHEAINKIADGKFCIIMNMPRCGKSKSTHIAREISLAMTNLEQSIMWATKALYFGADI